MKIPGLILKQMYTLGSLENVEDGVRFSLKNRLSDATLTRLGEVRIDGRAVPLSQLPLLLTGDSVLGSDIGPARSVPFPLAKVVEVHAQVEPLPKGPHEIALAFDTKPFGDPSFKVKDAFHAE